MSQQNTNQTSMFSIASIRNSIFAKINAVDSAANIPAETKEAATSSKDADAVNSQTPVVADKSTDGTCTDGNYVSSPQTLAEHGITQKDSVNIVASAGLDESTDDHMDVQLHNTSDATQSPAKVVTHGASSTEQSKICITAAEDGVTFQNGERMDTSMNEDSKQQSPSTQRVEGDCCLQFPSQTSQAEYTVIKTKIEDVSCSVQSTFYHAVDIGQAHTLNCGDDKQQCTTTVQPETEIKPFDDTPVKAEVIDAGCPFQKDATDFSQLVAESAENIIMKKETPEKNEENVDENSENVAVTRVEYRNAGSEGEQEEESSESSDVEPAGTTNRQSAMEADDSHVFPHLAASFTEKNGDDVVSTSDNKPLKNILDFNESDQEPLKRQIGFDTSDEEPLQKKVNCDIDDVIADPSYIPFSCEQPSASKEETTTEPPGYADNSSPPNDTDPLSDEVNTPSVSDICCPSSKPSCSVLTHSTVTSRKQSLYFTPARKKRARQREARPETWKNNVRKSLHLQGKQYVSQSGKVVPAKVMREVDCTKCRYKCTEKIPEERRKELFDAFYGLKSYKRQKNFVCANVSQKRTTTLFDENTQQPKEKKRHICRVFSFDIDGTVHRVCKNFFLATLALGETYVEHALENSTGGVFTGQELRGKAKPPHNKYSEEAVRKAREHMASFPVMESHYTRKDTQRLYLSSDLTLGKMYELYTAECQSANHSPVSARKYRDIFNQHFNYAFHHPKKDQCVTCTLFQQKGTAASEEEKLEYQTHRDRNNRARDEKDRDKREAANDSKKHVITVDLQAVLQAPCGLVNQPYKRKLSVYNFTVCSLTDKKVTCFTWDESEGKRGSCEIATCLYIYLSCLPKWTEEVIVFSDCCSGQNHIQCLSATLIHAVNNIPNIKTITHKNLETGHTHMECDSMHAAITFAKKHTPVYTPSGWHIILRMARRGQPYVIIPMKHNDFLDFKRLASIGMRNTKTDQRENKVNWRLIKAMQFRQGQEDLMFFKHSFDDQEFEILKIIHAQPLATEIPRCYPSRLPVSDAKKHDLLSLCQSGIIPAEHHSFYESLLSSPAAKDKLPEPDIMEDDCSDID